MVFVGIRSEYDGTFNNNGVQLRSLVDIYEEVEALWNVDGLHVHRSEFSSPSGIVRPQRNVCEYFVLSGNITSA
jgi:hypothetical protein